MSKGNQSFRDYVKEVKQLNQFENREIETTISKILQDPEKFGKDFVENNISRYFKRILEAKRLGMDFAKRNIPK